jgi:hypothetical protein
MAKIQLHLVQKQLQRNSNLLVHLITLFQLHGYNQLTKWEHCQ